MTVISKLENYLLTEIKVNEDIHDLYAHAATFATYAYVLRHFSEKIDDENFKQLAEFYAKICYLWSTPDKLDADAKNRVKDFLDTRNLFFVNKGVVPLVDKVLLDKLYLEWMKIVPELKPAALVRERILSDLVIPQSYQVIVGIPSNPLEKATQLLLDYTKNNSSLSRFFHGHWNRHHVAEVNILLNDKAITTVQDLIAKLDKIKLVNPEGSFAKRIFFIRHHLTKGILGLAEDELVNHVAFQKSLS